MKHMRLDIYLLLPDTAPVYVLVRICDVQTRRKNLTNNKVKVLSKIILTTKREAKSPITGAIKLPNTKFTLMRREVLTHGPSHKE